MPYDERDLQLKFIDWFQRHRGYRECADDAETGKATSMDSAGFIGKQPVLIEVKVSFDSGRIQYAQKQCGSIEHKIARGLQSLYGQREDIIATALAEWDGRTAPHICLVANRMSEPAQQQLSELLKQRSQEWRFSYAVYLWRWEQPVMVLDGIPTDLEVPVAEWPTIEDLMHDRAARTKKSNLEGLRQIAETHGVGDLFDVMLDHAMRLKGKRTPNVQNINFRFRHHLSKSESTAVGIWPGHSSVVDGLLVSYSLPDLQKCFRTSPDVETRLPGRATPRQGHLGESRYLRTVDEVNQFWRVIVA